MNYVLCLAGGKGTRMGNTGVPKQFIPINGKPIIIYTLENLLKVEKIDKVIVVCNQDYLMYLEDLLTDYNLKDKVEIAPGGKDRLQSTLNGINYIKNKYGIESDDIFIAHDSVRPFTKIEIINENIKMAHLYKAATTVYYLTETIVETNSDGNIFKLYPRENLYSGQSPQTFNINYFLDCTSKIPKEELSKFTDLSSNITYVGGTVVPVIGDKDNIKITTQFDLVLATSLLEKYDLN